MDPAPALLDPVLSTFHRAICLTRDGRRAEAEPLYREALTGLASHPMSGTFSTTCAFQLAECLHKRQQHAEAEPLYRQALTDSSEFGMVHRRGQDASARIHTIRTYGLAA